MVARGSELLPFCVKLLMSAFLEPLSFVKNAFFKINICFLIEIDKEPFRACKYFQP